MKFFTKNEQKLTCVRVIRVVGSHMRRRRSDITNVLNCLCDKRVPTLTTSNSICHHFQINISILNFPFLPF